MAKAIFTRKWLLNLRPISIGLPSCSLLHDSELSPFTKPLVTRADLVRQPQSFCFCASSWSIRRKLRSVAVAPRPPSARTIDKMVVGDCTVAEPRPDPARLADQPETEEGSSGKLASVDRHRSMMDALDRSLGKDGPLSTGPARVMASAVSLVVPGSWDQRLSMSLTLSCRLRWIAGTRTHGVPSGKRSQSVHDELAARPCITSPTAQQHGWAVAGIWIPVHPGVAPLHGAGRAATRDHKSAEVASRENRRPTALQC